MSLHMGLFRGFNNIRHFSVKSPQSVKDVDLTQSVKDIDLLQYLKKVDLPQSVKEVDLVQFLKKVDSHHSLNQELEDSDLYNEQLITKITHFIFKIVTQIIHFIFKVVVNIFSSLGIILIFFFIIG
jgi:ABC-type multidrug transport system fused ATPase/permease subunit